MPMQSRKSVSVSLSCFFIHVRVNKKHHATAGLKRGTHIPQERYTTKVNLDMVCAGQQRAGSEHAVGAGTAAKTLHQQRAPMTTQTRVTASYPNPPAHQGTGRRTVKDLLRNQARFGQEGKLAKGCVESINMLRSTLHLVCPFSHQSSFNKILKGLSLHLPSILRVVRLVAPCWYTLAQRYLFHIRWSAIPFSISDLPSKEHHQPSYPFNISCSLYVD
jgi:hypothetical protein